MLERVYVYEEAGGKVVWQINEIRKPKSNMANGLRYDPKRPIVYGNQIDGTTLIVEPQVLEIGKIYSMRGDFVSYDQISVLYSTYIKATFRLENRDGKLVVVPLLTMKDIQPARAQ
jgi:hypothetical protein